ncbi:MAG TPA: GNAT family N-acetyltransferase [Thermodesulfobacteriota bacterium]|nr:GNAT family N-acetyltransferase [Thermodesulfobacteriota bacterium]
MSSLDKMHSWKVRDGSKMDMGEILSLRGIVFREEEKDKLDPRFWGWEFLEGPDGQGWIYVVEDGSKIVGHFADIPRSFSVQGEPILGTLSLDLMVHPDYWRRGIFEALGRYGIERVRKENGRFLIAFPIRQETIQGLKKIGWKEVVKLPVLVYPIRFGGIINRYLHFPLLSLLAGGVVRFLFFLFRRFGRRNRSERIEIEEMVLLDDQFDRFWQKAVSLYPIMGVRNRTYLTWRYLRHPTRTYAIYRAKRSGEMKGYIVLRKVELLNFNSAVIVDLLALDEVTLTALVEKGIQRSRQEGADLLGFMVPRGHPYDKILRKRGFLPSPKTFQFMVYFHSKREMLNSPEKWYVNWGDTDVI